MVNTRLNTLLWITPMTILINSYCNWGFNVYFLFFSVILQLIFFKSSTLFSYRMNRKPYWNQQRMPLTFHPFLLTHFLLNNLKCTHCLLFPSVFEIMLGSSIDISPAFTLFSRSSYRFCTLYSGSKVPIFSTVLPSLFTGIG